MDSENYRNSYLSLSSGASKGHMFNMHSHRHDDSNLMMMTSGSGMIDDNEEDMMNDETFGGCDLDAIKKKSDFGPDGKFLGDQPMGDLPAFFEPLRSETSHLSRVHHDDPFQQPSIDALLGEDPMRFSSASLHRRANPIIQPLPVNPLFSMGASQAGDNPRANLYSQQQQQQQHSSRRSPMTLPPPPPQRPQPPPQPQQPQQQQINYQLLKQFEQLLINKQVPPQERLIYIKKMMEKMQSDAINAQQQQQIQLQQQQQQAARVSA